MAHEGFPEDERGHLGIRLIMEQMVERMLHRLGLAAILLIAVHVQRQTRNGLRQDAHTGVHRCHLHGGPFVHALSSYCTYCQMWRSWGHHGSETNH